ncbi:hypothetical protein QTP88_029222 [Uroleucon formosanum]
MFTGESGDTDAATEWINALKTVAHLNGWPDTYTLEAERSHLGGAARHWYLSQMAELDTMNKFITSFEMMFTSQESITETWRNMDERVQQRGETVPLQCSKCGAEGHTAKYCQKVTSDVALIDTNTVNRTLYVKRVQINEESEEVQGLVDTGSTLCIIKRSIAQKYGLTIKPLTVNLNVYGTSSCVIGGGETKAWLKIDSVKEPVDLLVVDDYIQNYDLLIGHTSINKENVSFI